MANHIGETVVIADTYTHGLLNDHVSVQWTTGLDPTTTRYNVYARTDYNAAGGPQPMPQTEIERRYSESSRGWGHMDEIGLKLTLDKAMEVAKPEAQKRGFVLLLDDIREKTIKWHPDGWQPRLG